MTILVFADSHDKPGTDQSRFDALGQLILDCKPDAIVQLGDFLTMDSLSRWNTNKRLTMEGVRYKADIASANNAIAKIFGPLELYNKRQRSLKKGIYTPQVYWFEGNHEFWLSQYLEQHPEMTGHVDIRQDLTLNEVNWVPYPNFIEIGGLYFVHAPQNKIGAISSRYVCDRTLDYYHKSTIFGHTHRLLLSSTFRYGATATQIALSAGCFFEEDPDYAANQPNDYWKGVLWLETLNEGPPSLQLIPMDWLKEKYINKATH